MLRIDRLEIQKNTGAEPGNFRIASDLGKTDGARWVLSRREFDHSIPVDQSPARDRIWVLLNGGPIDLEEDGKRPRRLRFLAPISLKASAKGVLNVFGKGDAFELNYDPTKIRAGLYPTFIRKDEDYQFPLPAQKHVLWVVNGELNVNDRNTGGSYVVGTSQGLLLGRDAEECLNLQAIADGDNATVLWAVIHELP